MLRTQVESCNQPNIESVMHVQFADPSSTGPHAFMHVGARTSAPVYLCIKFRVPMQTNKQTDAKSHAKRQVYHATESGKHKHEA